MQQIAMQITGKSLDVLVAEFKANEREHYARQGAILAEIQERRLYREMGIGTFEEFAEQVLNVSRRRAYQMIEAAETASGLCKILHNPPAIESQVRELTPLLRHDEAAVVEVWQELKAAETPHKPITAAVIREAVQQYINPAPTPKAHVAYNSGDNEWYTPPEYIAAARRVMGGIDLDPASSPKANEVIQAAKYCTAQDDGLRQQWQGRIWMNPPYASDLIGRFVTKLVGHFVDGKVPSAIVLVNNATETNWFQTLLAQSSAVCFIRQRVKFINPQGEACGAPLQGQAVLYLGDAPQRFDNEFIAFGPVLYARRPRQDS